MQVTGITYVRKVRRSPSNPKPDIQFKFLPESLWIERQGSSRNDVYSDPLDTPRGQGYGHWALEADVADGAHAQLVARSGRAVWPPAKTVRPGARFAYVKGPEGNLIELIQFSPLAA